MSPAGTLSIPRSYAQRIAWDAPVKAQAEALEATGLPPCEWVEAFTAEVPAEAKAQMRRAEEFQQHAMRCPRCIARAEYARDHLPPLPPPPLAYTVRVVLAVTDAIGRLPAWARPAVYGALIVSMMVLVRALLVSFSQGPGVWLFGQVGLALLVGAYLGVVGGITYSLVRPRLRRLGRLGGYLTGIACTTAYALAIAIPATVWLDEPGFTKPAGGSFSGVWR